MPVTPDPLARRYRRLLLCYPRDYRRERGAELVATLLEAAPPGRVRPSLREAANLIGHGVRARLGRPASRTVVAWAGLAAVVCGLFTAAVATRLAWETSRPLPDRAETAAVVADILPGHEVDGIEVPAALFTVYTEPLSLAALDSLLFGDGGEYAMASTSASRTGRAPVPIAQTAAVAEQRLRAGGWTLYAVVHRDMYGCAGPPCDPTSIPQDTRLSARRGDTVLELELYPQEYPDSTYLSLTLGRTTPPAVLPAGIVGGLLGAVVGGLVFGWASRRTQDPHPGRVAVNALFGMTMAMWWGPVLFAVPLMASHHVGESHPRWHPLWEWLGQPVYSLFFVVGCAFALLGLGLAALPSRQARPRRVTAT